METRILGEVEEMVSRLQAEQGRAVDIKQLMTSCVANVMMSMLFGRRFDHSDPEFQQMMTDINSLFSSVAFETEVFPLLRLLPHYKKSFADALAVMQNTSVFVEAQIAEYLEVSFSIQLTVLLLTNYSYMTYEMYSRSVCKIVSFAGHFFTIFHLKIFMMVSVPQGITWLERYIATKSRVVHGSGRHADRVGSGWVGSVTWRVGSDREKERQATYM